MRSSRRFTVSPLEAAMASRSSPSRRVRKSALVAADTGMRSKALWVMTTASQSPVAQRATNPFRAPALVSALPATRTRAWG